MSGVAVRRLSGFDDPALPPAAWDALLRAGDTDEVFLTPQWQRAWWESFGRGELLLLLAERDGEPVALAPLFTEAGMVYLVGSGGSDYLDFVGEAEAEVMDALLDSARQAVPGFLGFVFYHVPDPSRTGARLAEAAERLSLDIVDQGALPAPALGLQPDPAMAEAAVGKKSLVRHENGLRRAGDLATSTALRGAEAAAAVEVLFDQHIARWSGTPHPSLFLDPAQRAFYRRLVADDAHWLRVARIDWNGRPVAIHLGFHHRGRYLWYKPSFDVALARRSPGEVLLRQLIRAAMAEGAALFDFGLGDEAFKARFATEVRQVRTWGLYPRSAA